MDQHQDDKTSPNVFWIHIFSFALYNFLIGYTLLHREQPGLKSLALFGIAMSLHFVVNDFGLRELHKEYYKRIGRWLLAATVIIGYITGLEVSISKFMVAVLIAFLAGGVIMNTLKEELPEERKSRFVPFAFGVAAYAVLILSFE